MIRLEGEAATAALGARLGPLLRPGDAVFLFGDLGAGKSTLARAAIRAAVGAEIAVPSPTFTLMQSYEGAACSLHHIDLYRLSDPDETLELGVDEALEDGAVLVEWPERFGDLAPSDRLEIALEAPDAQSRSASLRAAGSRAERLLQALIA